MQDGKDTPVLRGRERRWVTRVERIPDWKTTFKGLFLKAGFRNMIKATIALTMKPSEGRSCDR